MPNNSKSDLPPSLATKPNIPYESQTLSQLRAERNYWDKKIKSATSWGASLGVANSFLRICDCWIARREAEALSSPT